MRHEDREEEPDRNPEGAADQSGDDALLPDHPAHLPAGHADGPQHAELARSLEHREDERVHDAEEADDHRQAEQPVEDVQSEVDVLRLCLLELVCRLDLRVRVRME